MGEYAALDPEDPQWNIQMVDAGKITRDNLILRNTEWWHWILKVWRIPKKWHATILESFATLLKSFATLLRSIATLLESLARLLES